MKNIQFQVAGMTCQGCVNSINRAITALAGVSNVHVNLAEQCVMLQLDEQLGSIEAVYAAIENLGFDIVE